jgi:putative hydrolase of the HAD superfamily
MTHRPPTLVIFDLDDTLYKYAPCDEEGQKALGTYASHALGISEHHFAKVFDLARMAVKTRLGKTASSHSRLLYCHESLELLGLRSEPRLALEMEQTYWRAYLAKSELREGCLDLLDALRYEGVPIAVVTDLTAQIQFRKLIYLDVAQYVDHIVCSEETLGEKTDFAPFELLATRVPQPLLENVWFIGDQLFDAPISELTSRGIIGGGFGFVRGRDLSLNTIQVQRWERFSEIESVFNRSSLNKT